MASRRDGGLDELADRKRRMHNSDSSMAAAQRSLRYTLSRLGLMAILLSLVAADAPPVLSFSLTCRAQKSYVLCLVPVNATPGSWIASAEAYYMKGPSFLTPVVSKATYADKTLVPDLRLGFTVRSAGAGDIFVFAHGNACPNGQGNCQHFSKMLTTRVVIPK
jgi:hypothetical protein